MKVETGLYVYCIGEYERLKPLLEGTLPDPVETEGKLVLVASRALAAVASPIRLSEYTGESIESNLADPAWLAVRAIRHEKVVEHFSSHSAVIPLRFGTIYRTRVRTQEMLRKNKVEFREILEELRGKEEWGLNIYCRTEQLLKALSKSSARARSPSRTLKSGSAGKAYLMRKKMESVRAEEGRQEIRRVVDGVKRKMAEASERVAAIPAEKGNVTAQGRLVGRLAFLVRQSAFQEFRSKAEQLARDYARAGFHFELTGPWPAYNFVRDIDA